MIRTAVKSKDDLSVEKKRASQSLTTLLVAALLSASLPSASLAEAPKGTEPAKGTEAKEAPKGLAADAVLARFNDKTITVKDVDKVIETSPQFGWILQQHPGRKDQLRLAVANNLVNQELLVTEAKKSGAVSDKEMKEAVDKVIEGYGGKEKLTELLKNIKTPYEKFAEEVGNTYLIRNYVEKELGKDVTVTDEEVKKHFDQNQSAYAEPEEVRARHILLRLEKNAPADEEKKVKEKIEEIRKEVAAPNADFAALSKKYSQDTTSQNGGDLGFFKKGVMVPEFEQAAFALKPGEISQPVKTAFGYHILKVEEKKAATPADFDKSKEKIKQELMNGKKDQILRAKLEELRQKAKVQIVENPAKG